MSNNKDSAIPEPSVDEALLKYELAVNVYTKERLLGGGSMEDFNEATSKELAEAKSQLYKLLVSRAEPFEKTSKHRDGLTHFAIPISAINDLFGEERK